MGVGVQESQKYIKKLILGHFKAKTGGFQEDRPIRKLGGSIAI